jgi:hypothetical protein
MAELDPALESLVSQVFHGMVDDDFLKKSSINAVPGPRF